MSPSAEMSADQAQITGLILAGGRGIRMGSVDKGLQQFRGQPMVQHVVQRLAPQVGSLIINANQHLADYAQFGYPVWPDATPDFAGPLAGLQAGLTHCQTPYLVSAPCDSPMLPDDLVVRLFEGLQKAKADIAVAVTAKDQQRHPVFCLMRRSVLDSLTAFLARGERKMDFWLATQVAVEVAFDDDAAFSNINTNEELQRLASQ
jgi:molybdopterin-guanine dinucleotide biosynthesis protein A